MSRAHPDFEPFAARMRAERLPTLVIETFARYYQQLVDGETGLIGEADIQPVDALPDAEQLEDAFAEAAREHAAQRTAVIKLNGGLGTSMGLARAKSLLVVKDDLSFLDIIARQALLAATPLLFMNSFSTRADTLAALSAYPGLKSASLPLDFLQHKVPRVIQSDLSPARWPASPEAEWCPPGHGDLYTALQTTGTLTRLLEAGYETAFVSNADNLGAVLDLRLLGYFLQRRLPFMMEVADRTPSDRKGGHLARRRTDGQLLLREVAQCPQEDLDAFQDISRHQFFNTNNLWIDLRALDALLSARSGVLELPMIRNHKHLDPRDPESPEVYQLETAMGSAIAVFDGAAAIRVPRDRFAPVKTLNDLLALRSDAFRLTPELRVIPDPRRAAPVSVDLDPQYFRLVEDLDRAFPQGPPSLLECASLRIIGDVRFGPRVTLKGKVTLSNTSQEPLWIPTDAVIEGS